MMPKAQARMGNRMVARTRFTEPSVMAFRRHFLGGFGKSPKSRLANSEE